MPQDKAEFKRATSAELDQLGEISPSDIERAKAAWRQDASPEFASLLDAEPTEIIPE